MTTTTNFEKVKEFNRAFEIDVPEHVQHDLFTKDPKLVRLKIDLITEEVNELVEAVRRSDLVETVDALADILYVVYGAGIAFGVDMDKAFELVHGSNMSKLCKTEHEAQQTVAWYQKQFKEKKLSYDTPVYKKSECGNRYIVLNGSTGKILKSIGYHPLDLEPVLNG